MTDTELRQLASQYIGLTAWTPCAPQELIELLARLEAAENDAAHQKALAESALRVAEGWESKCAALRAKIEQMEKQEPVAWTATDETCRIVEALSFNQSRRFDTPLGILPGAQPKPDCGEAGHDEGRCGNRQCLPGTQTQGEEK